MGPSGGPPAFVAVHSAGRLTIDPRLSLGRPTLPETGVRTAIIVQRFRGGDSLQALANDYGRSIGEIEEAVRFESRAA